MRKLAGKRRLKRTETAEYGEKWLWRRAAVEGALERVAPYASGVAIAFAWFVPK